MKKYNGFSELLADVNQLPETGWVFVDKKTNAESESSVKAASYYIAETEIEEISMEKDKKTFVECPTLVDIISNLDERSDAQGLDNYIEAVIYYRVNDDFLD